MRERRYGSWQNTSCASYRKIPSGLYADPTYYSAYEELDKLAREGTGLAILKEINNMGQADGLTRKMQETQAIIQLVQDIRTLIPQNGCTSSGLARLQDNLIRFSENKPPVTLNGEIQVKAVPAGIAQDYERLVRDLVKKDARNWISQLVPGSIRNIVIVEKDAEGRPALIALTYEMSNVLGKQQDKMHILFEAGVPDCIRFPNFKLGCNTPNREVVANYIAGRYRK